MLEPTSRAVSRIWATQGRYLRENMMRVFIEGIGHVEITNEFDERLNHAMANLSNETERMIETAQQITMENDNEDNDDD